MPLVLDSVSRIRPVMILLAYSLAAFLVDIGYSTNPCDRNPCRNGANCTVAGLVYTCRCTRFYNGSNCEHTTLRSGCLPHWIAWDYHCYHFSRDTSTFLSARSACKSQDQGFPGAGLVTIYSQEETNFLVSHSHPGNRGLSPSAWIGLTRNSAGSFNWEDGSPVRFTNWAKGEPNDDGGNEDCASVYYKEGPYQGAWNDDSCYKGQRYICKAKQLTPCGGNPCQHGGTCTVNGDKYVCSCQNGYTGSDCRDIPCGGKCRNGGTCKISRNQNLCQCAPGFRGLTCEEYGAISCHECSVCNDSQCSSCSQLTPDPPRIVGACSHCIKYTLELPNPDGGVTTVIRRVCERNRQTAFIGCQAHRVLSHNYTRTTCVCNNNLCNK